MHIAGTLLLLLPTLYLFLVGFRNRSHGSCLGCDWGTATGNEVRGGGDSDNKEKMDL